MNGDYPILTKRYIAAVLDLALLFIFMLIAAVVFQQESETVIRWRVFIILFLYFNYEPLMESRNCTLGKRLTGIRVRDYQDQSKEITIGKAYLRFVVKYVLGGLSFLTMFFNNQRRGLHDYLAKSIVVSAQTAEQAPANA